MFAGEKMTWRNNIWKRFFIIHLLCYYEWPALEFLSLLIYEDMASNTEIYIGYTI